MRVNSFGSKRPESGTKRTRSLYTIPGRQQAHRDPIQWLQRTGCSPEVSRQKAGGVFSEANTPRQICRWLWIALLSRRAAHLPWPKLIWFI